MSGIAVTELVLISPAVLFMSALFVRQLQPLQFEPAHTAQQIVTWYAGRGWTLWVLLISLPLTVLVIGCVTLLGSWKSRSESGRASRQLSSAVHLAPATLVIGAATFTAGGILAVVIVHMLMN